MRSVHILTCPEDNTRLKISLFQHYTQGTFFYVGLTIAKKVLLNERLLAKKN